jgi:hypothetical protein
MPSSQCCSSQRHRGAQRTERIFKKGMTKNMRRLVYSFPEIQRTIETRLTINRLTIILNKYLGCCIIVIGVFEAILFFNVFEMETVMAFAVAKIFLYN